MRVVLVYAKNRRIQQIADHSAGFGKQQGEYSFDEVYPPIGIASLGAVLREQGYEVRLLDDSVETEEAVDEGLQWADVVGIGALTSNARRGRELGLRARELGKFTILGGPHPTITPEYFLEAGACDVTVQSEADLTLPEIIEKKDRRSEWKDILGITYLEDGQMRANPRRPFNKALDSLPFPAYDLYDMPKYWKRMTNPGISIMSSRGCPYSCTFCDEEMTPRNYRALSAARTVDLIEYLLKTYNPPQLFFFDDLFTIQRKRVLAICEEILKRKLFFEWNCESRVDTVDYELLRAMRRAGCIKVYYGLESGSPEQLIAIKKKVTPEGILKGARLNRELAMYFKFFIIYGFPGETERDHRLTEDLIKKAMPHNVAVSLLCPHKGTEVYDQIKDRIIHHPEDVEYGYWHQTEMWRHDVFTYDELQAERKRLVQVHKSHCTGLKARLWRKLDRARAMIRHPELIGDLFEQRVRKLQYKRRIREWIKDGHMDVEAAMEHRRRAPTLAPTSHSFFSS